MFMHTSEIQNVAPVTTGRSSITIRKNDFDEYEVPNGEGDFYFTDDRDDAIETARLIHGAQVVIRFRRVQS